jgi:hypothetical protein
MEIFLPITFDADDKMHIRQPHSTEMGAFLHAELLGAQDKSIWRYEVHTFDLIRD